MLFKIKNIFCFFQACNCLYMLLLMAVYWCTETVPLAVTSLIPLVLAPLLSINKADTVARSYLKVKPPQNRPWSGVFFMSPTHLFHLQIGEERTPDLDNIHCAILYMSIKSSWLEISENCWSFDWLPVGISPTQNWKYWEVFPILIGQTRPALDSSLHTEHRHFCSFHPYLQNTKR